MKNFEVKYVKHSTHYEFDFIQINNKKYYKEDLSTESVDMLTLMAYTDYKATTEYFEGLVRILGYDLILDGILELSKLGANIAPAKVYRELVINSFKEKHKGLMR